MKKITSVLRFGVQSFFFLSSLPLSFSSIIKYQISSKSGPFKTPRRLHSRIQGFSSASSATARSCALTCVRATRASLGPDTSRAAILRQVSCASKDPSRLSKGVTSKWRVSRTDAHNFIFYAYALLKSDLAERTHLKQVLLSPPLSQTPLCSWKDLALTPPNINYHDDCCRVKKFCNKTQNNPNTD